MSNRRRSLRRVKKLKKITENHSFTRNYHFESEEKEKITGPLIMAFVIFALIILSVILMLTYIRGTGKKETTVKDTQTLKTTEMAATPEKTHTPPPVAYEPEIETVEMPEVATFLQGPKAWKSKTDWSGYWGNYETDGKKFSGFGCGLCCMANFYTSLTPYACSPIDMYKYAKKHSSYEGAGAIDWPHIQKVLEDLGFTVDTGRKPKKYSKFKKLIKESEATMVVVSSTEDDSFWKDTPGHYVTLWGYDEESDTVFLGDSGSGKRNRRRISLKTVYKALKVSNSKHYMRMLSYDESLDTWRHKKISGKWVKPEYFTK